MLSAHLLYRVIHLFGRKGVTSPRFLTLKQCEV
jgi:hypothetical protein